MPPEPLPRINTAPMAVGESREVQLYAMRLDVTNFEQALSLEDLQALPATTQDQMWLYDLDLNGHDGSPRLLDNALAQIRDKDPWAEGVGAAERNMIRLLNMTPGNAQLQGTRLEELIGIGPKIGIPSPQLLADALGISVDEPFVSPANLGQAVLHGVIGTHPNVQLRYGSKTPQHPDGLHPVPKGHLPVTLADVTSKLANLPQRFGPWDKGGQFHPGFVVGSTEADLLGEQFQMILRANANALPFKGVRLANATMGSVPSIGKDGEELFDFNDPQWLQLKGMASKPSVTKMTFQLVEHPKYLAPGDSPLPKGYGNGKVWQAPRWTIERVVAEAGRAQYKGRNYSKDYFLGGDPEPIVKVRIVDGWMTLATKGDIGKPPPPMYVWDVMAEVAQFRLHDAGTPDQPQLYGIAEGDANVRFELADVAVGVTAQQITDTVRANLEADASQLVGAAGQVLGQHQGQPDVFYYRPRATSPMAGQDWLYFVASSDIERGADGPVRSYPRPGFFRDAKLSDKASSTAWLDGDTEHEKVQVVAGQVLYCADAGGGVFQLTVLSKPSRARIALRVTRVQ